MSFTSSRVTFWLSLFFLSTACAPPTLIGSADPAHPNQEAAVEGDEQKTTEPPPYETITINGAEYVIPPPWAGNRMRAPALNFSAFRQIPTRYTYNGTKLYIVAEAHDPLVALLEAAERDNIVLQVESAYRSEAYQKRIFKRMIEAGRTFEDIVRYVAPPGYSQHMFGSAVDFYPSNWNFASTPAYEWLKENGHNLGFEETYQERNRWHMPWEAWHWNCVEAFNQQIQATGNQVSAQAR